MLKSIPWDTIGPIATGVVVILSLVFWFILKWQKQSGLIVFPRNSPRNAGTANRRDEVLCFKHEGEIQACQTAIEMFGKQFSALSTSNSAQHEKIFEKLENLRVEVIKEIKRVNGEIVDGKA